MTVIIPSLICTNLLQEKYKSKIHFISRLIAWYWIIVRNLIVKPGAGASLRWIIHGRVEGIIISNSTGIKILKRYYNFQGSHDLSYAFSELKFHRLWSKRLKSI